MTIATTHFSELKTLAYGNASFVNGSLEFDDISLSPTYRLRLGVPGSSKATTIAKRLGLLQEVVARANDLLQTSDQDLQRSISQLEERMRNLDGKEEELQQALLEAEQAQSEYEAKELALAEERDRSRNTFAKDLESEFQTTRDYLRHLIADLQKSPSIAKAQRVQKELESLRKELGWMDVSFAGGGVDKQAGQHKERMKIDPKTLAAGQPVRIRSLNQRGIVQELVAKSSKDSDEMLVLVQVGSIKIKLPASDIELLPDTSAGQKPPAKRAGRSLSSHSGLVEPAQTSAKRDPASSWTPGGRQQPGIDGPHVFVRTAVNTIDLRGQRVDEAIANLEQFIDHSVLNDLSPTMIIHGHGTGAVRDAVRQYLASSRYKATYRPGESYEGGNGVTIVEL